MNALANVSVASVPEWWESEEARNLLAEHDAAVRLSDHFVGLGWDDAAKGCSERASEIEQRLDELRDAAVNDGPPKFNSDWTDQQWDDWSDRDNFVDSVGVAVQRAHRYHWGDEIVAGIARS
jgi:hypothetical protein